MTPPPCTCGQVATGQVVEGHLHPYCAWREERARAQMLRAALVEITFPPDASRGEGYGCLDLTEARQISNAAIAADNEARR